MSKKKVAIGAVVAVIALGAIGSCVTPDDTNEPVALSTPVPATTAPSVAPVAPEPTEAPTPEPTATPEPTEAPTPAPATVTFKAKGTATTKAQPVAAGDYRAVVTASGCKGNIIVWLVPAGGETFLGEMLVNEIASGKFKGETYLYGLDEGRYVADGITLCKAWTVVLAPTE